MRITPGRIRLWFAGLLRRLPKGLGVVTTWAFSAFWAAVVSRLFSCFL